MNRLDGVAALALAGYLIGATYGGKWRELVALLRRDYTFIPWVIAVGILLGLRRVKNIGAPVDMLITAAFLGLVLLNYQRFETEVKYTWGFLRGQR